MFRKHLLSIEALVCALSLAACSTKPESVTPSSPTTEVREPPSAAAPSQAVNPSAAAGSTQAATAEASPWASGRRYTATRTARRVVDLLLCPDGRIAYYDEGKPRVGTFAVEGSVVHAKYEKSTEDYALSDDLKSLTLPSGSFVVYDGVPTCSALPEHASAK